MQPRRLEAILVLATMVAVVAMLAVSTKSRPARRQSSLPQIRARSMSERHPTAATNPAGDPSSIAGRVLDDQGHPIAGALARVCWVRPGPLESIDVRTGPDGRFRIEDISKSGFEVVGLAAGHAPLHRKDVVLGQSDLELRLERHGRVRGVVVRAADGNRISTPCRAWLSGAKENEVGLSSWGLDRLKDALLEFEGIVPGRWRVAAEADGYCKGESAEFELRPGETLDGVLVPLVEGGRIRGTVVRDRTGELLAGAVVERIIARSSGWEFGRVVQESQETRTDKSGRFEMLFSPGRHRIRVRHDDHIERIEVVYTERDTPLPLQIRLRDGGQVEGDLVGGPDPTRQFVNIHAVAHAGGRVHYASTDQQAHYVFKHLPPGRYTLQALLPHPQRMLAALDVEVRDGETTRCELSTQETWTVRGHVRAAGQPIARTLVEILAGERRITHAETQDDGMFEVNGVPPGDYEIRISAWRGLLRLPPGGGSLERDFDLSGGRLTCVVHLGDAGSDGGCISGLPCNGWVVLSRDGRSVYCGYVSITPTCIEGLEPGRYEVRGCGISPRGRIESVMIEEATTSELRFDYHYKTRLRLWVRDSAGLPIESASVRAFDAGGVELPIPVEYTGAGEVEWEYLNPAEYVIEVEANGLRGRFPIDFRKDREAEVTLASPR